MPETRSEIPKRIPEGGIKISEGVPEGRITAPAGGFNYLKEYLAECLSSCGRV